MKIYLYLATEFAALLVKKEIKKIKNAKNNFGPNENWSNFGPL